MAAKWVDPSCTPPRTKLEIKLNQKYSPWITNWKLAEEVTFNKDRNHLKMVGRAGSGEELAQPPQEASQGGGGISQEWGCFPWEEWGQTQAGLPSWEPQSQEQQPIQHPARTGSGVSICQAERQVVGDKATCLKTKPEHRIFMCSHSSEALWREGGVD